MNILFLDIDGMLNCRTTKERWNGTIDIDQEKIFILKRIVDSCDVKIVLSSTWRRNKERHDRVVEFLKDINVKLYGATPKSSNSPRWREIADWCSENIAWNPKVDHCKIVILDDDSDARLGWSDTLFLQTTFELGLTDEIADKIIEFFS